MSATTTTDAFCNGKRAFANRVEAERAATKTSRGKDKRLRAYKCERCKQYHYGQSDRPKNAERRSAKREEEIICR